MSELDHYLYHRWNFERGGLSPLQRRQMLSGLNRTLVSQGSLFIQSQTQPKFYLEYLLNHHEKMSLNAGNYQQFLMIVAMVKRSVEPDLLFYQSTTNETKLLAEESGFVAVLTKKLEY